MSGVSWQCVKNFRGLTTVPAMRLRPIGQGVKQPAALSSYTCLGCIARTHGCVRRAFATYIARSVVCVSVGYAGEVCKTDEPI